MIAFEKVGFENTEDVIKAVRDRIVGLNIKKVVVASSTGETALKLVKELDGVEVIVVRLAYGYPEANTQKMTGEMEDKLKALGVKIVTAAHVMGSLGRAVRKKLGTYQIDEVIGYTLRVFGDGVKVAAEISLMATDCGYLESGETVVAIGGKGKGADSAIIVEAANTHNFFDMKVKEIICKPF